MNTNASVHVVMIFALLLLGSSPSLAQHPLQNVPPAPPPGTTRGVEGYVRTILTITFDGTPLKEALETIAARAGLPLLYDDKAIPATARVRATLDGVTLDSALKLITRGLPVDARVSADRGSILVRHLASPHDTVSQNQGVLMGRVIDSATQEPIPNATVTLQGANQVTTTDAAGRYRFFYVPARTYTLAVQRLGYTAARRNIAVHAGKTTVTDLSLSLVVSHLEEVVSTATGAQRRIEVGNTISTIKADSLTANSLINTVTDLLAARVPGVQVLRSSGSVGAPSRIRIRGVNSAVLNNDPIIIVDGVRMNAEATSGLNKSNQTSTIQTVAGLTRVVASTRTVPSPLDYLDPNSIESIDILKGPSAASLYGTDATNGVIIIKTKRGQAGPTRFTLRGDRGWSTIPGEFPNMYYGMGVSDRAPGPYATSCTLANVMAGICTQERVIAYSPMNDPLTTTQGTGHQTRLYGDLSGGTSIFQYFTGGTFEHTIGTTQLSQVERSRILRKKGSVPEWQDRPNGMNSVNVSGRLQAQSRSGFTMQSSLQVLTNDTWDAGIGSGSEYYLSTLIDSTNFRPGDLFANRTTTNRQRALGSVGLTYTSGSWLSLRSTSGLDYEARVDKTRREPGDCAVATSCQEGTYSKYDGRTTARSADLAATLTVPLQSWLHLRSTIGGQYNRIRANGTRITASGTVLGLGSANGALVTIPPEEVIDDAATAGMYIEEQLAFNDRLFLTAGLRRDAGSAFAGAPVYPKFSGSWVVSRERFFPTVPWISNVRLRTAYGHSGKQPRLTDLLRLYQPVQSYTFGKIGAGLIPLYLGNTSLRPERGREWEGGIDLGLFDDRIQVDASTYRRVQDDALYGQAAPPSVGSTVSLQDRTIGSMRYENIGSVENRGLELGITARLITRQMFAWEVVISASANRNRVLKVSNDTMQFGTADQMVREGYPLFSQWRRPLLGYGDLDDDGLISKDEIVLGDTAIYMGAPYPKSERSYTNTVQLWNGRIRVSSLIQHTQGMLVVHQSYPTDRGAIDPTASLAAQAVAIAAYASQTAADGFYSSTGYRETADWIRLSEFSVQYVLPPALARQLRSRMASVALLGRNLALWSRYRSGGGDPEVISQSGFSREMRVDDNSAIPQTREWTIRVNLSF